MGSHNDPACSTAPTVAIEAVWWQKPEWAKSAFANVLQKPVYTVMMLDKLHPLTADFPDSPVGWKSSAAEDSALAELLPITSVGFRCLRLPHFSSPSQTYVRWIAGRRSCIAGIYSHMQLFGGEHGESTGTILRWGSKRAKSRLPKAVISQDRQMRQCLGIIWEMPGSMSDTLFFHGTATSYTSSDSAGKATWCQIKTKWTCSSTSSRPFISISVQTLL